MNVNTIQQAIERSRSHNEIVTLDWDAAAINDAVDYILSTYDGEIDYVRNGEIMEVWGWTEEQDEGEMDFRVHLRAVPVLAEVEDAPEVTPDMFARAVVRKGLQPIADIISRAIEYTVINDGVFRYPVLTADIVRSGKSQADLRAMDGDDYAAWCQDVPTACADVGSQECIDLCEALESAGAKHWHIA